MPEGFKSLKDAFNKEPGLFVVRNIVKQNDVINEFHKIFPDLVKVAKPMRVFKKSLSIRVENAAWRNELKFREMEMVKKINDFFKEKRIDKIKFQ